MSEGPRILIVDDHETVRDGLRGIFGLEKLEVCGEATSGFESIEKAVQLQPDVIIQDVILPGLDGIEAVRQIKKHCPNTEIVLFTGLLVDDLVLQGFEAGARSFILKTDSRADLLAAVRAAMNHQPYFTPRVAEIVFANMHGTPPEGAATAVEASILSPRERQALQIIANGKSNKELAEELGVSVRTAESHRAAIMQKLSLKNIGEIIRYAIRHGIIQPVVVAAAIIGVVSMSRVF